MLGRCKLTPTGYARLFEIRRSLNWLHNQALDQRKTACEADWKSISLYRMLAQPGRGHDQARAQTLFRKFVGAVARVAIEGHGSWCGSAARQTTRVRLQPASQTLDSPSPGSATMP